ncbi:MAG: adenosylcobinamide-phosphate synthase CbiB [Acidobacteria bacterium]|nr:adenosylcobinamide-phosphate synthase CbiB [Acidobacteriota bacterium]
MRPQRLLLAYILDLVLGDPQGWPHPVRWMGRMISWGERWVGRSSRSPTGELLGGTVLANSLVAISFLASRYAIERLSRRQNTVGLTAEVLLAWTCLATRSLQREAGGVVDALDAEDLPTARERLSRIVGRDTIHLDESAICRAVIETVAESTCDGVIGPLTFFAVAGVPAAMAYKAINTLDSMIGHVEQPYTYLGWCAARTDDLANFLPARLTALCIVVAAALVRQDAAAAWRIWHRDGSKHLSPNAGRCEAAMAGALGVRLGGTNTYDGRPCHREYLGDGQRECQRQDARKALRIALVSSVLACSMALACSHWLIRREKSQ